MTIDNKMDCSS